MNYKTFSKKEKNDYFTSVFEMKAYYLKDGFAQYVDLIEQAWIADLLERFRKSPFNFSLSPTTICAYYQIVQR